MAILLLVQACATSKQKEDVQTKNKDKTLEFEHYYYAADKAKVLGNYEEALALYKKALKAKPKSHAAMYQISKVLEERKSYTEAIYWAENAVKNASEYNHWYYYQLAQLQQKNKNFSGSSDVYVQMMEKDPERKTNYTEAANLLVRSGNLKRAAECLEEYHERFGIEEKTARNLETAYRSLGKPQKALATIQALSNAYPNEMRYKALLAESLLKAGERKEAKNLYLSLVALDNANGVAHFGLSELYKQDNQKDSFYHHLVLGFSDNRIGIQPKLRFLPYFFKRMKTDEEAKETANLLTQSLIETHENEALAHITRADFFMEIRNLESARNELLKAVDLESGDYKTWEKLIQVDDELENNSYLYEDSKAALELFPNINYIQLVHAYACAQLKKYREAVLVAEPALDFTTDIEIKMQFLSILGSAYHNLGEGDKSNAAMDELLLINPDDDSILNNYAFYLAERSERLDKALAMIKKALDVQPNSSIYQDTYGWILFKKGDYKNAEVWLKKAYDANPTDLDVKKHYEKVLNKLGRSLEQ
jgi:tetratricopeptide (TPR) repeat protein